MTLTRVQAKRAVVWEEFKAKPRTKRKDSPRCVTCGAQSTHPYTQGEPAFRCGPHDPVRIADDIMARARAEFVGRERKAD